MKLKYNSEIISGAVFLVAAIVLWLLIPSQINTMETSQVTAQTMPKIVIGGLGIFSFCLLMQGIFTIPKKEVYISRAAMASEEFRKEMKSVIYAAIFLAYLAAFSWLGFLASSVLLTVAILLFYGARRWYYYAIPLAMIVVVYFVFKILLKVSLP